MVRTSKNNIEKCLNLLLDEKILINFLDSNSEKLIESIYDNWSEIKELWLKKQHYTFGRVICNLRLIPSFTIENHIWDINLYNLLSYNITICHIRLNIEVSHHILKHRYYHIILQYVIFIETKT